MNLHLFVLVLVSVASLKGAEFSIIEHGFYSYPQQKVAPPAGAQPDTGSKSPSLKRVGKVGKLVISAGVLPKRDLTITDTEIRFDFLDENSVIPHIILTGKDRVALLASDVVAVPPAHFIQLFFIDRYSPKNGIEIFISDRSHRIHKHVLLAENPEITSGEK
jgi:hypothetical protein